MSILEVSYDACVIRNGACEVQPGTVTPTQVWTRWP
jgi:hypothetical protein